MWQTILCFFDAHPWFLPSVAAIIILLTTAYKIAAWAGRMIAAAWRTHQENKILRYLAKQLDTVPAAPDSYGQTPNRYCSTIQIANAVGRKPFKVRETLERLKKQNRVEQRLGLDLWRISGYEMAARSKRLRSK